MLFQMMVLGSILIIAPICVFFQIAYINLFYTAFLPLQQIDSITIIYIDRILLEYSAQMEK